MRIIAHILLVIAVFILVVQPAMAIGLDAFTVITETMEGLTR